MHHTMTSSNVHACMKRQVLRMIFSSPSLIESSHIRQKLLTCFTILLVTFIPAIDVSVTLFTGRDADTTATDVISRQAGSIRCHSWFGKQLSRCGDGRDDDEVDRSDERKMNTWGER
jgi:hypothetical protein